MVTYHYKIILSLFILIFSLHTQAAEVSVTVDRGSIRLNESFMLTFEGDSLEGSPDFSQLKQNFDIINHQRSQQMSIINGQVSRSLKLILVLQAKKAGTFIIEPIAFGSARTQKISITILPEDAATSSQDDDVFIETDISTKTAYVQAQLILTVKVYYALKLQQGGLSEPVLDDADAVVIRLGKDKSYQTAKNNRNYNVIERRYLIFPQQSGKLEISPVEFKGQFLIGHHRFSIYNQPQTQMKRLHSKKIKINIKPIPQEYRHPHWLPAKNVKLTENWDAKTNFNVGEPVTRTIRIEATGQSKSQLPIIKPVAQDGLKQYTDQPVIIDELRSSGVIGIREEKIAIIPSTPGTYQLPEIVVPWWNTQTHKLELARLPARTIKVKGEANASTQSNAKTNTTNVSDTPDLKQAPLTENTQQTISAPTPPSDSMWFMVSIAMAILWLLTVGLWYFSRKQTDAAEIKPTDKKELNLAAAKNKLKTACQSGDATDCKLALLHWGQSYWPDKNIINLSELAKCVCGELSEQIEQLNKVLYGASADTWQAGNIYQLVIEFEKTSVKDNGDKNEDSSLPPLLKLQSKK